MAITSNRMVEHLWTPAIGEEFVCCQERGKDHNKHAVAVHAEGVDVLGHLPGEI